MSKKLFGSRRIIGPCYGLSGCPPCSLAAIDACRSDHDLPELDQPDKVAASVPRDAGLMQVVFGPTVSAVGPLFLSRREDRIEALTGF